jgi:hypothetical protein
LLNDNVRRSVESVNNATDATSLIMTTITTKHGAATQVELKQHCNGNKEPGDVESQQHIIHLALLSELFSEKGRV